MNCVWIIAFAAISVAVADNAIFDKPLVSKSIIDVNLLCIYDHCFPELVACADPGCQKDLKCVGSCLANWDKDTTPGKSEILNCTTICQFTYFDDNVDNFLNCLVENSCISLPPVPSTCVPSPKPVKQLSVVDLRGDWWVVRGYNPVQDCRPCMHQHFQSISETTFEDDLDEIVTLTDGTHKAISQKYDMPIESPGEGFTFQFDYAGGANNITWWVLDKADDGSYALVYYCGAALGNWNYVGGQVLARNTSLSPEAYAKITDSFESSVGLDLSEFCYNEVKDCNNGKYQGL